MTTISKMTHGFRKEFWTKAMGLKLELHLVQGFLQWLAWNSWWLSSYAEKLSNAKKSWLQDNTRKVVSVPTVEWPTHPYGGEMARDSISVMLAVSTIRWTARIGHWRGPRSDRWSVIGSNPDQSIIEMNGLIAKQLKTSIRICSKKLIEGERRK